MTAHAPARAVMIACAILLLVGGLAPASPSAAGAAFQHRIIPDASHRLVRLGYDFRGEELVLFGAIAPPLAAHGRADIVIAIEGPRRPAVLWHKRRLAGLWVDEPMARLADSPAFYALLASRSLSEIASARVLTRLRLPPEQIPLHLLDDEGAMRRPASPDGCGSGTEGAGADRYALRPGYRNRTRGRALACQFAVAGQPGRRTVLSTDPVVPRRRGDRSGADDIRRSQNRHRATGRPCGASRPVAVWSGGGVAVAAGRLARQSVWSPTPFLGPRFFDDADGEPRRCHAVLRSRRHARFLTLPP